MRFRTKLFLIVATTITITVTLVTWGLSRATTSAFEQVEQERTRALIGQFQREFTVESEDIVRRVEVIAESARAQRMAARLVRATNYPRYVNEASELARAQRLDFLELVASDGTIVSSAHWPARFGYKNPWVTTSNEQSAFLHRVELAEGPALALLAVRTVTAGDSPTFVVGGKRLDSAFLDSLVLPEGMRALLYRNLTEEFGAAGPLQPLLEEVRATGEEQTHTVEWTDGKEAFHAIPLNGLDDELLAVLLVGSSRERVAEVARLIQILGITVGAVGIILGLALSWWVTARVTRPVKQLADGAAEVAGGNWDARVEAESGDEIGDLGRAFNQMTEQLATQREKLIQTERVAAWRELARRLAHELKNPLFPMQITVENVRRAKEQYADQFDEVFKESTDTLLTELGNLRSIVSRFSDFAKMPPPELETVNMNDIVRTSLRLFEAQLGPGSDPPMETRASFDEEIPVIRADPELLRRAFRNLILNAMDAMPDGGQITLRTSRHNGGVRVEISDTGEGLTEEECSRLFTPYYTTKHHGTGLGLAIVQSVVSDHGARISVASEPGRGATFSIDFPVD